MSLKIAPDKWKHLFVGIAMGVIFQLAGFWLLHQHPYRATAIAFVIIFSISYGWELLSKFTGKGHYEIMDAVYSIVGGMLGMGIVIIALQVI
jgi:hypothetical protein